MSDEKVYLSLIGKLAKDNNIRAELAKLNSSDVELEKHTGIILAVKKYILSHAYRYGYSKNGQKIRVDAATRIKYIFTDLLRTKLSKEEMMELEKIISHDLEKVSDDELNLIKGLHSIANQDFNPERRQILKAGLGAAAGRRPKGPRSPRRSRAASSRGHCAPSS